MTAKWQRLDFDSDFFGFPIGRIQLDGADEAGIREAEAEAREDGIACLFALLDPSDAEASYRVQELGYRFVDTAARFEVLPHEEVAPVTTTCTVRTGQAADVDEVIESVLTMAPWSRFAADPRFGLEASRRMHRAWVDRAVACTTGEHSLMVAEDETGIVGFLTRSASPTPMINTVGTIAPGTGAAHALFAESREWARPQPISAGWAASRNIGVQRFLGRCGFRLAEVRYHFHRWLIDEDGTD